GLGQGEAEYGPAFRIGTGPQAPVMRFDDGTANVQTHAQAFGLGAVEGLEKPFRIAQAMAVIDDGDFDQGGLIGDPQVQAAAFAVFHGLDAVLQQVQQDLLDEDGVSQDFGHGIGQVLDDLDAALAGVDIGESDGVLHDPA